MTVNASGIMMSQARADDVMNELTGGTASALTFGSNQTTAFAINAGYSRTLMANMIQGTFYGTLATAGGTTAFQLMVGPTFDLPIDNTGLHNAVFLRAVGGLFWTNSAALSTSSTSAFAYNVAIGKRFELFSVVHWNPEFSVSGQTISGSNPTWSFTPISLSFLF
jgi:hypothetical protein